VREKEMLPNLSDQFSLPAWLPDAAQLYLHHTELGVSLRELARNRGVHASTVMRQVRRYENRREDPLVDAALSALGNQHETPSSPPSAKDDCPMTAPIRHDALAIDETTILAEARRVLRRLAEADTVLAIAQDMEKAAVLRSLPDGRTLRMAVVDRAVTQVFALKDWIVCRKPGRISTYVITPAGRSALRRMTDEGLTGLAEAHAGFEGTPGEWDGRRVDNEDAEQRARYTSTESPIVVLARRRDKDGKPFLTPDLVAAAERLREDFELAQMGPRVTQNWERFLTGAERIKPKPGSGPRDASQSPRDRVSAALRDLGPGLGDMVLRCCCYLEGMETAEQRMGWSARSGKIVLRIALQRLRRHYEETYGKFAPLIG
jgi:hypothetical protein